MKNKSAQSFKISKGLMAVIAAGIAVAAVVLIKSIMWGELSSMEADAQRIKGNPQSPVRIVEYVDFQCPACAHGYKQINTYIKTFPDQIYLELKYFPLGGHTHSLPAAKFVECAARQGKFWEFLDVLFERQKKWMELFDAHPAFMEIAKETGLNVNTLEACVSRDDVRQKILADKDAGQKLGIQSTPTYFINGTMFVGVKPMTEELQKILKNDINVQPVE